MASPQPVGYAPSPPAPRGPIKRPKSLVVAVFCIGLAAVCGIANLIYSLTSGKEALQPYLDQELADLAGVKSVEALHQTGIYQTAFDAAYDGLLAGAYVITFFAAVYAISALLIVMGLNWARITWVVLSVIGLFFLLLNVLDPGVPTPLNLMDGTAIICLLLALVLVWVGGSNAYFKARKQARKGA